MTNHYGWGESRSMALRAGLGLATALGLLLTPAAAQAQGAAPRTGEKPAGEKPAGDRPPTRDRDRVPERGTPRATAPILNPTRREPGTVPALVPDRNRKLSPGDVIEILVDSAPENSGKFRIFSDGSFDYVIGATRHEVKVSSFTTGDLEKDLTNRLKSQLRRPIVRVTLIEAYEPPRPEPMEPEPFRVTVLGAVEKPGELDLLKPKPLRTVLAELGITKDANLGEVQVLRPGANRALVFDYSQFAVSGDIRREGEVVEDYVLQGGEEVRVPARAPEPKQAVLRVEVLGRVGNPGPVELESGFSLLDALKKAGPAHPSADLTQVEISSSRGAQTVNLESFIAGNPASRYELRSGDRIVFKEKPTKVLVIGEVNQPNEYYIPDDATLLSIYTQAGAKNGNGDDKNIQILRSVAGKQEILKFNLQEIVSGKKENPRLKNGDVVFVPGRKSKRGALYYLNALSTPLFLFRGF